MTAIKVTLGPVTAGAARRLAEPRGITVPALVNELIKEKALLVFASRPHGEGEAGRSQPAADAGRQ